VSLLCYESRSEETKDCKSKWSNNRVLSPSKFAGIVNNLANKREGTVVVKLRRFIYLEFLRKKLTTNDNKNDFFDNFV